MSAIYSTSVYLMDFGFEYTACGNSEMWYEEAVERMKQATSAAWQKFSAISSTDFSL